VNVPLLSDILGTNPDSSSEQHPDYNENSVEDIMAEEKKSLIQSFSDAIQDDKLFQQEKVPLEFIKHLKNQFNPSQYYAIQLAATCKQGFTLIQGPPGTGKTTTIIGLLNTIHLREFNKYYQELLKVFTQTHEGVSIQQNLSMTHLQRESHILQLLNKYSKHKPRILIVAPSNIAVDNVISRIMKDGFLDGQKNIYKPQLVRVGHSRTQSVGSVHLDHLVDQEIYTKLSFHEKQKLLEELNQSISNLILDISKLQIILINLIKAFQICSPLPYGWELRVAIDDFHPYWVDHTKKATSLEPPLQLLEKLMKAPPKATVKDEQKRSESPIPLRLQGDKRFFYYHFEELPEYQINSHRFTSLMSQLEHISLKRDRLLTVVNMQNVRGKDTIPLSIRELLETNIIEGAQLLFTTLNSCGHPSMETAEFCVTMIDEAAQSTEPSTLIALRKGCKQCIMVGDQRQLPATIFSDTVMKYNYNRSLFERLIEGGHRYVMLDTQYRMVPEISGFPSEFFYYSKLLDGKNVEELSYLPSYIRPNRFIVERKPLITEGTMENSAENSFEEKIVKLQRENPQQDYSLFYPQMFFNLLSSKDTSSSQQSSKMNREEIKLIISIIKILFFEVEKQYERQFPTEYSEIRQFLSNENTTASIQEKRQKENSFNSKIADFIGSIGIITPYSEQLNELNREFFQLGFIRKKPSSSEDSRNNQQPEQKRKYCKYQKLSIELNTVDGFQGKEKDLIIMTTVRANEEKKIGFLSDIRRLNVAITRAKYGLFIVGNAETLSSNRYWRYLINHMTKKNAILTVPNNEISLRKILIDHHVKFNNYPPKTNPVRDPREKESNSRQPQDPLPIPDYVSEENEHFPLPPPPPVDDDPEEGEVISLENALALANDQNNNQAFAEIDQFISSHQTPTGFAIETIAISSDYNENNHVYYPENNCIPTVNDYNNNFNTNNNQFVYDNFPPSSTENPIEQNYNQFFPIPSLPPMKNEFSSQGLDQNGNSNNFFPTENQYGGQTQIHGNEHDFKQNQYNSSGYSVPSANDAFAFEASANSLYDNNWQNNNNNNHYQNQQMNNNYPQSIPGGQQQKQQQFLSQQGQGQLQFDQNGIPTGRKREQTYPPIKSEENSNKRRKLGDHFSQLNNSSRSPSKTNSSGRTTPKTPPPPPPPSPPAEDGEVEDGEVIEL
jgi:superfamily I DNA and/or RNA helicase